MAKRGKWDRTTSLKTWLANTSPTLHITDADDLANYYIAAGAARGRFVHPLHAMKAAQMTLKRRSDRAAGIRSNPFAGYFAGDEDLF